MSLVPDHLLYTKDHEWVQLNPDGTALVGITDHAQANLGDVTFVELPEPGRQFGGGQPFGVVESVKAASDLYMPLAGEILESNTALVEAPELVNRDPYGQAWMIRLRLLEPIASPSLLSPEQYRARI